VGKRRQKIKGSTMNYEQTVNYLFSNLPMFQRTGPAAYKANLDNTHALDEFFGHPHRSFKTVHIAGTNGKGSVSHMLAAVLQTAGYKTGLFTSPHLIDFRERIRINGEMISEEYVCRFVNENKSLIEKISPSFFELTTLMAFRYFADSNIDIAVIETGMGGRLDSTNIITPLVSVITNIGLDHTQFLGNTPELIAAEKAGIIKKKVPVVIGEWQKETEPVYREFAEKMHSELYVASQKYQIQSSFQSPERKQLMYVQSDGKLVYEKLAVDLLGLYQKKNVPTVLQTIDCLRLKGIDISREVIYDALQKVTAITGLRGRWEAIGFNPLIICDTGHNAAGISEVVEQIKQTAYRNLHFVFGMVSDKDPGSVLSLLPKNARYYFTKADIPRALDPSLLMKQASTFGLTGEAYEIASDAYEAARTKSAKEDLIIIGGSTFVVAEVLKYN
jgi:dihydrofolate synthase/folylpolyglutamate synthase